MRPTAVNIYETLNGGAVVSVQGKDGNGQWKVLWSDNQPEHIKEKRIFSPSISLVIAIYLYYNMKLSVCMSI